MLDGTVYPLNQYLEYHAVLDPRTPETLEEHSEPQHPMYVTTSSSYG